MAQGTSFLTQLKEYETLIKFASWRYHIPGRLDPEDLYQEGISVPIICGGAALSHNFVENKIQTAYKNDVYYAKDAMSGIRILKNIFKN